MAAEKPADAGEQWVPVSVLAVMLGMTARRVQQLVNDGVLPKTLHGKYALTKCIHAYIAHLKSLSDGNVAASERAKLLRAQREKAEIEIDALRRELIPAEEVRNHVGRCLTNARSILLAVQAGIAQRYGKDAGEYAREEHDRALEEIARGSA